jgi:protein-S-isoprenylcysteine O-methyltransferase Ste14
VTGSNRNDSNRIFKRTVRAAAWIAVGALGLGVLVLAPVVAVVSGVSIFSQATLDESVIVVTALIVFTVGYWGLVVWVEKRGFAQWNDDTNAVGPSLTELDEAPAFDASATRR